MKDGNFYQVSGWMGRRLGLRGNDLICFAIIYGFSQDGESQFKGTVDYLCDWMFCSKPTALLCLGHLINLELISKEEVMINGKKRCYYATNVLFENGELVCINTSKEPLPNTSKEPLPKTGKGPLPYNNNINNNKEKRECNKLPSQKKVFVKPTVEQIKAYIKENGYHFDAEQFWNHYESVGWMIGKNHMKDWHCACATWEGRRKQEQREKEEKEETSNEIPAADIEPWESTKNWMKENTPSLSDRITYKDFAEMRGYACFNSKLFADTLKTIHASGYDGDIIAEFKRLVDEV